MQLGTISGRRAAAIWAGLLGMTLSCAQPPSETPAEQPIEFRLATDVLPSGGIMLSNGVLVQPSDWRAVILAQVPGTATERERTCTGSLVGTNVVLLAAHCVDRTIGGPPRRARLAIDDGFADLVCSMHKVYADLEPRIFDARGSEDYALCLLKLSDSARKRLETIRTEVLDDATILPAGTKVLMSGYGCSKLRVAEGSLDYERSDRQLRIGDGEVDTPASGQPPLPTYLTIRSPETSSPAICPGDSGGPLFIGATAAMPDQSRRIVGVNSAVNFKVRADGGYDLISYVAATGNATFREWALNWINENRSSKPIICGVNRKANVPPCRP